MNQSVGTVRKTPSIGGNSGFGWVLKNGKREKLKYWLRKCSLGFLQGNAIKPEIPTISVLTWFPMLVRLVLRKLVGASANEWPRRKNCGFFIPGQETGMAGKLLSFLTCQI